MSFCYWGVQTCTIMKNQAYFIQLFSLLFLLTFLSHSCKKSTEVLTQSTEEGTNFQLKDGEDPAPCEAVSYDIYGGQSILAGNITVSNDGVNLYITYNTSGCWTLAETHLYVGSLADLPTNRANVPIPGQFPYSGTHSNINTYTYTIPLAGLPECYIIAAHSALACVGEGGEVIQEETGWSFGTPFPNTKRWGWYSEYCTQFCEG